MAQPRDRRAVVAILVAVALATLDTAIANTALPAIAADLRAAPAASVWVINAYQLAMVATILPLAALGEIVGHRRIYISGLAIFTLASLAFALATTLPALAGARALQGIGASGVMSVNAALLRLVFPPGKLGRGVGLNSLAVGVSFAVGPTVASLILSVASWPWLFGINVPLGCVVLALAVPSLPRSARGRHRFDGPAALLTVVAFTAPGDKPHAHREQAAARLLAIADRLSVAAPGCADDAGGRRNPGDAVNAPR